MRDHRGGATLGGMGALAPLGPMAAYFGAVGEPFGRYGFGRWGYGAPLAPMAPMVPTPLPLAAAAARGPGGVRNSTAAMIETGIDDNYEAVRCSGS